MDVRPLGEELAADPHAFGPYCFVLERPVLLAEPIKLKGKLGLFEPTPETAAALAAAEPAADAEVTRAECERVGRALEMPEDERAIERCWNYVRADNFDAAARIATRLIDNQTRLGEAFGFRSWARLGLDQVAEALGDAEAAIAAAPRGSTPDRATRRPRAHPAGALGPAYDVLRDRRAGGDRVPCSVRTSVRARWPKARMSYARSEV